MSRYLVTILALALSGCVRYVNVPVAICPELTVPNMIELRTERLSKEDKPSDIIKAMTIDIVNLKLYSEELRLLIEGYSGFSVKEID